LREGSGHAMTIADLNDRLQTFLSYPSDEVELLGAELAQLMQSGKVRVASDGKAPEYDKYYLTDQEERFLARGSLHKIEGEPILRTNAAIRELVKSGKVNRVLMFEDGKLCLRYWFPKAMPHYKHLRCYLPAKLEWLQNNLPYLRSENLRIGRTYIPASQFDLLQGYLLLNVGLEKEGRVVVSSTPENRAEHADKIVEYERIRLESEIIDQFKKSAGEYFERIKKIAAEIEAYQPIYISYFKARKIIQRMGSPALAYAAMISELPEDVKAKLFKSVFQQDDPGVKKRIEFALRYQLFPFDARQRPGILTQQTFLDTHQRFREKMAPDIEALLLAWVNNLTRAVYYPETLSVIALEELRYLTGSLAGKHRFPRLSAQLKDLWLMLHSPVDFEKTVRIYRGLVGDQPRNISDAALASAVKKNKDKIAEILGVKESELMIMYRGKSYYSTARKRREVDERGNPRGIKDARGVYVVVDIKDPSMDSHEADRKATEVIKAAKKELIELLLRSQGMEVKEYDHSVPGGDANVKDSLEGGRADTRWRVLKIYGKLNTVEGAPIPLEIMFQTRNAYRLGERFPDESHEQRAMKGELGGQTFRPLPIDTLWRLSLDRNEYLKALKDAYEGERYVYVMNECVPSGEAGQTKYSLKLLMDQNQRIDISNPNRYFADLQAFPLRRNPRTREIIGLTPEDVYCAYSNPNHDRRDLSTLGSYKVYRIEADKEGKPHLVEKKPAKDGSIFMDDGDVVIFHKRPGALHRGNTQAFYANRYLPWMKRVQSAAAYPVTSFSAWTEGHKTEVARDYEVENIQTRMAGWARIRRVITDETGRTTRSGKLAASIEEKELVGKIASFMGFDSSESLILALGIPDMVDEDYLVDTAGDAWKTAGITVEITEGSAPRTQKIELHMRDWVGLLHNMFMQGIFPIERVIDFHAESTDADNRIKITLTISADDKPYDKSALLQRLQEFDVVHRKTVNDTQQLSRLQNYVFVKLLVNPENQRWLKLVELLGYLNGFPGVFPDSVRLGNSLKGQEGVITIMMPEALRDQQIAMEETSDERMRVGGLFTLLEKFGTIVR
jgi:hypothetical protein